MSETELKSAEALIASGDRLAARAALGRVLGADPAHVQAQLLMATIDMDDREFGAAARKLESLIATHPDLAPAHYNLGVCLIEQNNAAGAMAAFRRVVALEPSHAGAQYNVAWLMARDGQFDAAAEGFAALVRQMPGWLSAWEALIETHIARGRAKDALDAADEVVRRNAGNARVLRLRGTALQQMGRAEEAEATLRSVVAENPNDPDALMALAGAFRGEGKLNEAIPVYERAIVVAAGQPAVADRFDPALSELIVTCRSQAQWRRLAVYEDQALKRVAVEDGAISPGALMHFCDDPAVLQRGARNAWRNAGPARVVPPPARASGGALRIGWLSDNFSDHAGSFQLAAYIAQLDRSRVEMVGYNMGVPIPSDIRYQLRHAFGDFKSLRVLSEEAGAQLIENDGLDLLVCSVSFGPGLRKGLLRRRPAPVIAAYLGHPGTLGSGVVDYIIADRFTVRPGEESHYDEAVVRLPHAMRCILPAPAAPQGRGWRTDHGLRDGDFVFCNFGSTEYIGASTFDTWMQILKDTPRSVLWLGEARHSVRQVLHAEAQARGIDTQRVVFAPLVPRDVHLTRLAHADLFLDTLGAQDATPVHDALSAGVPVLSLSGKSLSTRAGADLVAAAGLDALVTGSLEAYRSTAIRLGQAPGDMMELRNALRAAMATRPVFNAGAFFGHLQRGFEMMIDRRRAGTGVAGFDVPA
jgi:protein O-GlcNAc transferase